MSSLKSALQLGLTAWTGACQLCAACSCMAVVAALWTSSACPQAHRSNHKAGTEPCISSLAYGSG